MTLIPATLNVIPVGAVPESMQTYVPYVCHFIQNKKPFFLYFFYHSTISIFYVVYSTVRYRTSEKIQKNIDFFFIRTTYRQYRSIKTFEVISSQRNQSILRIEIVRYDTVVCFVKLYESNGIRTQNHNHWITYVKIYVRNSYLGRQYGNGRRKRNKKERHAGLFFVGI